MATEDNSLEINVTLVDEASAGLAELADEVAGVADDIAAAGEEMASSMEEATASMDASISEAASLFAAASTEIDGSLASVGLAEDALTVDLSVAGAEIGNALLSQQASFDLLAEVAKTDIEEVQDLILQEGITYEEAAATIEEANAEIAASTSETAAVTRGDFLQLAIGAGIAFMAVKSGIDAAVSSAEAWDKTSAVIAQELKDTGASIPLSDMQAYAQALQQNTLFSQQSVLDAEQLIASHRSLQSAYQETTGLAADLATHMGTDLPAATKMLTNALTDPVAGFNQLIRQGNMDFPASAVTAIQAMAKMGDTAGADALILNTLKGSIGGAAQAAAGAPGAALVQLSNDLGDMAKTIGDALLPVLDQLAKDLEPIIMGIAAWAEAHPKLTALIVLGTAAVTAIVLALAVLGVIIMSVGAAVTALTAVFGIFTAVAAAPWIGIGLLIIAFIALLVLVWTHWQQIQSWLLGAWADLGTAWTFLTQAWGNGLQVFATLFSNIWSGIKDAFLGFVNDMIGFVEGYTNAWINAVNFIIKALDTIKVSIPSWVPGIGGSNFGINLPMVPTISLPRLEFGGQVPGSRGEAVPIIAHGGETVIPAEYQNSAGQGQTVIVQIVQPTVRRTSDIQDMKNMIDQVMRPLLRNAKIIHV